MPRWLQITLSLVLFAIVMLALRAVLHAWVPTINTMITERVGEFGWWAIFLLVMAGAAFVGYWPRTPDGRLRPLLPTRR